ncbi:LmbE-like protein [Coccomyxa subellipsoidea C-169]|uniref:N-acetylglucosaminylphosphatidylinositol deacetylase n=1 Tax=Coccomyxa subellipsoidea (strain C-169) TaxID=574566 RepID=I0YRI0_COCSC|nr:LmbE-like protein [Coccomyxa subellipsoidea C-169]EIE20999.1 LmbE-like protein [Coccomyxa subellipsoidea C-169]|eukprot:XP_005645543.1 LmbE-like protein [Coccomyxa subellipsoidea C-169]
MFLPETSKQAEQQASAWGASPGRLFRCRQACQDREGNRRRIAVASLLALCVGSLLLLETGSLGRLAESPISNPGRVLLVTAHPDDEVIFFSSTISALHASGLEVFLLCLTNGDAHGLGGVRERELRAAAKALQIDSLHLNILNDSRIQDGHHEEWEQEYVAAVVRKEVRRLLINTIITFDPAGVTGHKNHKGCHDGVRQYVTACVREEGMQRCPDAWSLTTTDDVRTHLSIFDIIPSAIDGHRGNESAMFLNHDLLGMFKAMAAHKSQSRWWRHVLLTRYTFVNTLQRVQPLLTEWTLPLPAPSGLAATAATAEEAGEPQGDQVTTAAMTSGAAAKRDKFMARMSRRVMKNIRR